MKLFLTGLPGVGKSTLLRRATEGLPCRIDGIKTLPGPEEEAGCSSVYLLSWSADPSVLPPDAVAGRRDRARGRAEGRPRVFDGLGAEILRRAASLADLVIMDELGFMEAEARVFQAAVFDILDGPLPVLGVIKPKDLPFLNRVRAHRAAEVWTVTRENRDRLCEPLRRRLEAVFFEDVRKNK
jgi:nucleoside-triphosphatase